MGIPALKALKKSPKSTNHHHGIVDRMANGIAYISTALEGLRGGGSWFCSAPDGQKQQQQHEALRLDPPCPLWPLGHICTCSGRDANNTSGPEKRPLVWDVLLRPPLGRLAPGWEAAGANPRAHTRTSRRVALSVGSLPAGGHLRPDLSLLGHQKHGPSHQPAPYRRRGGAPPLGRDRVRPRDPGRRQRHRSGAAGPSRSHWSGDLHASRALGFC